MKGDDITPRGASLEGCDSGYNNWPILILFVANNNYYCNLILLYSFQEMKWKLKIYGFQSMTAPLMEIINENLYFNFTLK